MNLFHSLRWRLQFWYALLLAIALAGLGASAWQLQRTNQFARIDRELEQRLAIIERASASGALDGPRQGAPGELNLPARDRSIFEGADGRQFYYVVWLRDGKIWSASAGAPPDIRPPERRAGPPAFRSRGELRECFHCTQDGKCTLVGRDIGAELLSGRRSAWMLISIGGALLALGIGGGWWIVARSLRPVAEITATAGKIASGDLSQRIRTPDPKGELGRLSVDLNDTFARLQDAFARQGQFTADASHELRTPLSVILTETQNALSRERSASEARESLEICRRAAERMRRLTESLLTLAKVDAGSVGSGGEICELSRVLKDAADLVMPLAREKSVALDLELETVSCRGNPEHLAQVAGNILGNAIHYNVPGGSVRASVRREGDRAILEVGDTGQGISPADLPHIFDRFYRADTARSGAGSHAGLGLSIAKALVEAHGGRISATSVVGSGSTFVIELPAVDG